MYSRRGRYSREEVEALVEGYEELAEVRDTTRPRLRIVHGLLDLELALPALTLKQRQAVLLLGQMGFSYRQAAQLLGISPSAAWKRYQSALDNLTETMTKGGM